MSKLEEALQEKIEFLLEEKDELESSLQRVEVQLELCQGLLQGEVGEPIEAPPKKKVGRPRKAVEKAPVKKRGRPSKKKVDPEKEERLRQELEAAGPLPEGMAGTTKEEQAKAIKRFRPSPRGPEEGYGGVKVGGEKGRPLDTTPSDHKGHKNISIEDED